MKIIKFLIFFLISVISFTVISKAITIPVDYKEGIYNISEDKGLNSTAKLLTPNNITSLIVVDTNSNEKFYKRFDTVDEVITLGSIKKGDVIIIAGKGEITINFTN
ncbi:hypothetical protein psyc5s11_28920 [Clostridium gelidum]|uniref:Uncharacterized protein n=1 Tax=Clostridium gelidum TaxID=704125 RepID=A0ABN6IXG7_9CLOT|nr:hypothetical protein [Clostridium gelidum]BCZ46825.1 hypothetical protein psyc5s11_28920 [Clostridium gelidum]